MVKLIIEDDEGKTTVVPLIRDEITIGRKEGNTIRLTERNVSRRHARLLKQNGGAIFIEDLNSYNGIKVNGNKIAGRVAVAEGDRIQIGDYVLGLKMEGAPDVVSDAPTLSQSADSASDAPTVPSEAQTTQIEVTEEIPPPSEPADAALSGEAKPKPAARAGRLVCVSTNFPGQEWKLDKPLIVIGRTYDNDVVVDHRSISRHHARIVEEHGRYTIVDLQSSNGVRVNGEDYGKVELRRGDLIDLGHVRLRFIAPGEDFVFSRDASVVDISKAGGRRGLVWMAITVLVLLGAGALFWKFVFPPGGGAGSESGSSTASPGSGGSGGSGAPTPNPDAEQSQLATDLSNAIANEQWVAAVEACAKLRDSKKDSLKPECQKAALEKTAKENFEKAFTAAVGNRDLEAVRLWSRIPESSTYKDRDRPIIDRAREKALARLRADLADSIAEHSCDKAQHLASSIKELAPSDNEAVARARDCSTQVAEVTPPPDMKKVRRPPPVRKVQPKKVDPVPVIDPAQAQAQANQLVQQAQSAYAAGQHAAASRLAKQALKLQSSHQMAIQILGASACYLKNEVEAKSAFNRLPTGPRNLLRSVCQKVGIAL